VLLAKATANKIPKSRKSRAADDFDDFYDGYIDVQLTVVGLSHSIQHSAYTLALQVMWDQYYR
jgi:hypothetical protein